MLQRNGLRKSLGVKALRRPSQFKLRKRVGSSSGTATATAVGATGGVSIGHSTTMGASHKENEDRAVYEVLSLKESPVVSGYVGVFDGHGGPQCSEYCSSVLGTHIKEKFSVAGVWEAAEEALREVFHDIDKEFCEIAEAKENLSGACATVVVLQENELIIGNIGDCKAVLQPINTSGSYCTDPVDITEDHRADSTAEEQRIHEAGGEVKNGRILSLQPSRSFGDIDVKGGAGKDVVIAHPDIDRVFVYCSDSIKSDRPFLVVASDGVWDVLTSKQVTTVAKAALKKFQCNPNICAEKIVEQAVKNGSLDDVTVAVVVW